MHRHSLYLCHANAVHAPNSTCSIQSKLHLSNVILKGKVKVESSMALPQCHIIIMIIIITIINLNIYTYDYIIFYSANYGNIKGMVILKLTFQTE